MVNEVIDNSPYAEDLNQILNNNPQEQEFWEAYLNPEKDTFGNATKSGLAAGWTDSGAQKIKDQRWFKSGVRRLDMADDSEVVLSEMLKLPKNKIKMVDGVETAVEDTGLIKIRQDTAKYITSTLMKKTYSTKTEIDNNVKLDVMDKISDEEFDKLLEDYGKRKNNKKADTDEAV